MKGDQCTDGDDGPTCQKANTTGMPEMPDCNPVCGDGCSCLLGRCVCGEVTSETDLSMGDMWKIVNCAAETVGKVKKACKNDCMKDDSSLQGCSECVLMKTKCLQASLQQALPSGNGTETTQA